ncbi:MAG TPA: hypothetical protein VHX38_02550 [Pseudonocardiaceae bacterium]|jgi:hypothetical protein|nr:hypothetical protein [Pseudonocardiaceae bacterium]
MDASTKAQEMLNAVRAGKTLFYRNAQYWDVVGPARQIQVGRDVIVTKADGSLAEVHITNVTGTYEKQGVAYATAEVNHIRNLRPARMAADTDAYREVYSPVYGRGRVYNVQPGATQYDDGSGNYNVQIWDNS